MAGAWRLPRMGDKRPSCELVSNATLCSHVVLCLPGARAGAGAAAQELRLWLRLVRGRGTPGDHLRRVVEAVRRAAGRRPPGCGRRAGGGGRAVSRRPWRGSTRTRHASSAAAMGCSRGAVALIAYRLIDLLFR